MVEAGLVEEARSVLPFRHLNALNTVGYKELFQYFDGQWTLDFALEKIRRFVVLYYLSVLRRCKYIRFL